MKASRLMLTNRESCAAIETVDGGLKHHLVPSTIVGAPLTSAQSAKVLAVLLREAKRSEQTIYAQRFLERIIRETGLTWPVKAKG